MERKSWNPTDIRFVCYLDIMGFKDMVMRKSHSDIYNLLLRLSKHRLQLERQDSSMGFEDDLIKIISFSDSIMIFTKTDSNDCFEALTFSANWLFNKALENGIALKGAISLGEISVNISRQIYFGQPIIDAYLLEEDVEFYGIIIHNTVESYINDGVITSPVLMYYKDAVTPLKSGRIKHYILDWVHSLINEENPNKPMDKAIWLLQKQRESTSGKPRRYIDNTLSVLNSLYTINRD